MKKRMRIFLLAGLAVSALFGASASAQTAYPNKPIRLVVGFPPGGGNDIMARLLAAKMQASMGQTVLVENRPGASGILATEHVAKSPADGYTLLIGAAGAMTVNPALYGSGKLSYDSQRDFAPISQIGYFPLVLAVHPSVGAQNVQELVQLSKANRGKLNYSAGSSTFQLATEQFKLQTGADFTHVPYKGSGPAIVALLANEVQLTMSDIAPMVQHIKAGKFRALAVTSKVRSKTLPDVPTVAEAGIPDYEAGTWTSLFAPAGTSPAIVTRLQQEVAKAVHQPDVLEKMTSFGIIPVGGTPAELAAVMKAEIERWTTVAKAAQVKPE